MPRRFDRLVFVIGLLLALSFIGGQAVNRIEYYRFATNLAKPPAELADIPGVQPREILVPFTSADSCWWIMHTEAMIRSGDWRVRETHRDNAPQGREVHWSSGLMWLLALLAWLIHLSAGIPTVAAVQHAALIAGPLMLAGFALAFAWMAARRWGGAAGGLIALALATLAPLDSFFCAGEADHHGMVSCFALGCVLSAIAAGGGRVARATHDVAPHGLVPDLAKARRWMICSGLFGAAGLWVSSATVVPVFIGVAFGAVVSAWSSRSQKEAKTEAMPGLWRIWGISGALGSLAFYLLEYAPSHFGWRLEVNHPLYAVAFWGGGELLARLCGLARGDRFLAGARGHLLVASAASAIVALPLLIRIGGVSVFSIQDPFLWSLHQGYILEFRPLGKVLNGATWQQIMSIFPAWPLLGLPIAWLLLRKRSDREFNAPLAIALCAPLPITVLSIFQVRWVGVAQTLWLGLAVACLVLWRTASPRPPKSATVGGMLVLMAGLGVFPALSIPQWSKPQKINTEEATTLVMRDIAWKLRVFAGSKPINIVSGPTTTTNLAFFGDTNAIGTLYWENLAGLKTVAAIYGAQNEEDALKICREHAVTHIVLFSWDAFAQPYARLHLGRPVDANTDDCFISALLNKRSIPLWLRPLPYKLVPELVQAGQWALICEVRPDQTPAEAYYYLGKYLAETDRPDRALNLLIQSWNLDSSNVATGLELGHSLVNANRTAEAQKLAALLPPPERASVEAHIGRHFLNTGRHREAANALRAALAIKANDRDTATDLAWLLATSEEPSLRDGRESLNIMKQLGDVGQTFSLREAYVLAAAYAETGEFSQAMAIIDQAIETAEREKRADLLKELETHRISYAKNKAFRTPVAQAQ